MSRYIDAEYVNAFPIRIDHYDEKHGNRHFVLGIESVMEYIEEAPSIDIVRCKECRHWNEEDHWCNIRDSYGWDYKPDDFCSYGQKGDENVETD